MLLDAAKSLASKATTTARSVRVIRQAGLMGRPDEGIRSLLTMHKVGPFAGVLAVGAKKDPRAVALVDEAGELTYEQLDLRSNALARAWAQRGVRPGTVIAALCRDHRGLVTAMAASGKAGAKLLLLNTGFGKPQLADVMRREGAVKLVYDQEFTALLEAVDGEVERYLAWTDESTSAPDEVLDLERLIAETSDKPVPTPPRPGSFILLTSGTTGTPKGAPRERTSAIASAQFLDRIPLRPKQALFMAAPAFHGTGLAQLLLALALGNKIIMRRRFDPEETLKAIANHRCQVLVVVPTMLQRILDLPAEVRKRYDASSLQIIFAAGSAIPVDVVNRTLDTYGDVLYNLYGSTEVAVATVATPADLRRDPRTAGRAPIGCSVRLYDSAGQPITEPNKVGRIFVGSSLSFKGYTGGAHKEVLDGLLSSGDMGYFDASGLLFVVGRDDDMIVSGGENVYPLEVEDLLSSRSDVLEAAVVGVEDEEFGQRLRAYVVLADGERGDDQRAAELRAYVKANLARYKTPRDVIFVSELPRNATGKLLRGKLG